jgi:hypothetical protein
MTGSFDAGTLTYEGTLSSDEMGDMVTTVEYASLEDFVEEAAAVGRVRATTETLASDVVSMVTTFEYDADKRMISEFVDDENPNAHDQDITFSEWDTEGRPTAGVLNIPTFDCTDIGVTIVYDDDARKMTRTVDPTAGTGADCGSRDPTDSWKVYDENGIVIESTMGLNDQGEPNVGTTTVEETDQICL